MSPARHSRGLGTVRLIVILLMLATMAWAVQYQLTTAKVSRQRNRMLSEMRIRGVKALTILAADITNTVVYLGDCPINQTVMQTPQQGTATGRMISIRSAEGLDVSPMQLLGQAGGQYVAVLNDNNFKSGSAMTLCNAGTMVDVNVLGITAINGKPAFRALQIDRPVSFIDWQQPAAVAITKKVSYWIEDYQGIPSLVEQSAADKKLFSIKGVRNLKLIYHFIDGTSNETYQATPDLAGFELLIDVMPTFGSSVAELALLSPEQRQGITMSYTIPMVKMSPLMPQYEVSVRPAKVEEELDGLQVALRR